MGSRPYFCADRMRNFLNSTPDSRSTARRIGYPRSNRIYNEIFDGNQSDNYAHATAFGDTTGNIRAQQCAYFHPSGSINLNHSARARRSDCCTGQAIAAHFHFGSGGGDRCEEFNSPAHDSLTAARHQASLHDQFADRLEGGLPDYPG